MKLVLAAALAALLSGCGAWSHGVAMLTGYDRVCVEGLYYIQMPWGAVLELSADGRPRTCK